MLDIFPGGHYNKIYISRGEKCKFPRLRCNFDFRPGNLSIRSVTGSTALISFTSRQCAVRVLKLLVGGTDRGVLKLLVGGTDRGVLKLLVDGTDRDVLELLLGGMDRDVLELLLEVRTVMFWSYCSMVRTTVS